MLKDGYYIHLLTHNFVRAAALTHITGPEYAAKHRQRTQQALLNRYV
jgi:hypothetical protein